MELYEKLSILNELTEELLAKAEIYRNDPNGAIIKPEFIVFEHKKEKIKEDAVVETEVAVDETEEVGEEVKPKKQKLDNEITGPKWDNKQEKKKQERLKLTRRSDSKICPFLSKCTECDYGDKCKYSHDIKQWYFNEKPKDISTNCFVFDYYGYCSFGLSCRFSSKHVEFKDDKFENIKNENFTTIKIYNVLTSGLKTQLWKKKYDFKRSRIINDAVNKYVSSKLNFKYNKNKGIVQKNAIIKEEGVEAEEEENKKVGSLTDDDLIKLRDCEKKKIDWKDKLYLAPLTTVGNLPFRRICKEFGVDITCCEMAMSTNLLNGQVSEWALLKRHESEDLFGIQLEGAYADTLTKACQIIKDNNFKIDFIDINCGCPIDLVFNKGAGCALMTRLDQFEKIIRSLDLLMDCPITAKIRTGIKDDLLVGHEIVPQLKTWGVSMITLHGRTKNQRYSKLADWSYIDKCAQLSDPIPFFGCGDILSYQDYYDHMENTKISGCMIARGALYKPWIFTEIKDRRDWDISSAERFEILKKFTNYGLSHWGSDAQGVETTRKFLLEWLSFLYRYIPIGLLEQLPQRINLRPPTFFGRNELETLMASPNCSDWLKLTEMLLGPAPSGFYFQPKHKANGY